MGDGDRRGARGGAFSGRQTTVKDRLQELIATIGENMTLRRLAELAVGKGVIASYVHDAVAEGLGKIGVLVALEFDGRRRRSSRPLGRQIAMHVAAASPVAVDASRHRPGDDRARERDPAREERRQARPRPREDRRERPEELLQGGHPARAGLRHDPSKSVAQVLKEAEGKAGEPVTLDGLRPLRARRGHREGRRTGLRRRGRGAGGARRSDGQRTAALGRRFRTDGERGRSDGDRASGVLVKLSGEALPAPDGYWLDPQTLSGLAADIAAATAAGFEIALVIGGGNIFRGVRMSAAGLDRPRRPPIPWACWRR